MATLGGIEPWYIMNWMRLEASNVDARGCVKCRFLKGKLSRSPWLECNGMGQWDCCCRERFGGDVGQLQA